MRTAFDTPFAAFVILMIALFAAPATAAAPSGGWFESLDLGRQAILAKSTPGMIYVNSSRALPCKQMEEETFSDPAVQQLLGDFVRVSLDATADARLREELTIIRVPTVIFTDKQGREIDRAVGFKTAADFAQYLDRVLQFHTTGAGRELFATSAIDVTVPRPDTTRLGLTYSAPSARSVQLVGDFNDWRTDNRAGLMQRDPSGVWFLDVYLTNGTYEYLYYVDDGQYMPDPRNPLRKANPYEGFNSVLLVGDATTSPLVEGRTVTFIVYDTEASKVEIAGSFNNWQPFQLYRRADDPGMWGARYTLPPGRYQYKFLIDGDWRIDPLNVLPENDGADNINSTFYVQ